MNRSLSLKLRVRYEGLVQTFDRRPKAEIKAEIFSMPARRPQAIRSPRPADHQPRLRKTVHPARRNSVPVPALSVPALAAAAA
jgi:hypothetical protein